jgi:hypothetical protein
MSNVDPPKNGDEPRCSLKDIYIWKLEDTVNIEYKTNKENKQNKTRNT